MWSTGAYGGGLPRFGQGVKGPRRGGGNLFRGRFSTYAAISSFGCRFDVRPWGAGH